MLCGFSCIWSKGNLSRCATHIEEAVGVMILAMVVLLRVIEAAQQIIRRYPAVQTLGFARDNLNMGIAIRKNEIRIRLQVCAH